MEKVKQLLDNYCDAYLESIIISNPKVKDENKATKIKVRPVQIKEQLLFQIESFIGPKAFHENASKELLCEKLLQDILPDFKQMQLAHANAEATVLISKSGTVTTKIKKKQNADEKKPVSLSHNRKKEYILKEGIPVPFLIDLGVQSPDGKIVHSKYDKFKQINRFLEFIEDVLPALPKDRTVSIVDFGCGKSYLTFAMYYYLKVLKGYDLDVIGLDLKADVISHCNQLKDKYEYEGLQFLVGDISQYKGKAEADMVVTLHACDTATDYAIAQAIAWNASVILSVPCCQHELNRQIKNADLEPVLKYGLLKDRLAAIFTDAIRANLMEEYGYETQVLEFIDMSHTPKNVLLRGVKKAGMRKKTNNAIKVQRLLESLEAKQTLQQLLNN